MSNSFNKKLDELKGVFDSIFIELDKSNSSKFEKDVEVLLETINEFVDELDEIYSIRNKISSQEDVYIDSCEEEYEDIEEIEDFFEC